MAAAELVVKQELVVKLSDSQRAPVERVPACSTPAAPQPACGLRP